MLNTLVVTATARAGQKSPRGRVRPARTTSIVITRATARGWSSHGWEAACMTRYGRPTTEPFAPVKSLRTAIRTAQHEAGAFVPEREWRDLKTAGCLAMVGGRPGLTWSLHRARGSYLVWGTGACGWDGRFHQQYGVRGRRAGVRAFQHAIRFGEVNGGVFASHEEESH
ncbi:hypothetical protein ACIQF6_35950 [Kitasatospora sp. NPDC092948]|uniref:hypothetical protein n=1 Tax=Kitasatospora sp. NPDC092948 TaxID=3364088 RepID=UPI0037FBD625